MVNSMACSSHYSSYIFFLVPTLAGDGMVREVDIHARGRHYLTPAATGDTSWSPVGLPSSSHMGLPSSPEKEVEGGTVNRDSDDDISRKYRVQELSKRDNNESVIDVSKRTMVSHRDNMKEAIKRKEIVRRTDKNTNFNPVVVRRRERDAVEVDPRRIMLFTTFDAWLAAFQQTFKRDMILNVGKVGGLILLHYLAPGLLSWLSNTFGSFG